MAIGGDTSASGAALRSLVEKQTWFQEHSNFVTTVIGFLATIAAWAATQPFATSPWAQSLIVLVGFAATAAGVSVTPNGFTNSQMRKINAAQADIIGSTKLVVPQFAPPEPELSAEALAEQVEEFNRERFGEP